MEKYCSDCTQYDRLVGTYLQGRCMRFDKEVKYLTPACEFFRPTDEWLEEEKSENSGPDNIYLCLREL